MVNIANGIKIGAKAAARYGPHAKAAWDTVGQQATDAAKAQALRAKAICKDSKSRFYHGMTLFDLRAGRCLPPYGDLPPRVQPQA